MNPDLHFEMHDHIAVVRLNRPTKRNALNDALIASLREVFENLPDHARAAVLHGSGDHFCAGLDLSELQSRDAGQGMHHSRMWHRAFEQIQFGTVPVVAALQGAVVGGGLELAASAISEWQTTPRFTHYQKAHAAYLSAAAVRYAFRN